MVTKAEMHKKMIKTVLDKLPSYIENYSPQKQVLLNEFLNLANDFEKAEKKRTELINNYEEYTKGLLGTKKYFQIPFLWFTVSYFAQARLTLNWTNFQAVSFYEYLAKFLRRSPKHQGVFELLRNQTPLDDGKWEELQYACTKMLKPLTKEQMKIIKGEIAIIKNEGLYSLDLRVMKKKLANIFQTRTRIDNVLTAFFTNLRSQWYINYHSSAFGIERIFFHIEETKSKIDEIIDFNNPENTILCLSDIFVSRDNNNEYLGMIFVPTQDIKSFFTYMKKQEQKRNFKINELVQVKTSYRGLSLERYKEEKGWSTIGKADRQRLSKELKKNNGERKTEESPLTYISSQLNQNWKFNKHQLPIELIKLYCDVNPIYEYSELPLGTVNKKRKNTISRKNVGLLNQLTYNNVVTIDWIPWRLVFEFSLDYYWIKIPKKYLNAINKVIKIVPIITVYIAEENIYLWLHATPLIANWMKNELEWQIYPISRYFYPHNPLFNWFEQEELRWRTPKVIITKSE